MLREEDLEMKEDDDCLEGMIEDFYLVLQKHKDDDEEMGELFDRIDRLRMKKMK